MNEYRLKYYPNSLKEAKESGYKYYYTGVPCSKGHYSLRRTSARSCVVCQRISTKKYRDKNLDKLRAKERESYKRDNKKILERKAKWRRENRDKVNQIAKNYRKRHPAKVKADKIKRYLSVKQATPTWADYFKMNIFYSYGRTLNLEVDHIVPLKSDAVCGLHWEGNFQLLTKSHNASKRNEYWPDMWENIK